MEENMDMMFEATDSKENDPNFDVVLKDDTISAKDLVSDQTQDTKVEDQDVDVPAAKPKKGKSALPIVIFIIIFIGIMVAIVFIVSSRKQAQQAEIQASIDQSIKDAEYESLMNETVAPVETVEAPVNIDFYNNDQREILRSYGLNNDEITALENQQADYNDVVNNLRSKIYQRYQEIAKEAFADLNHEGIPGEGQWPIDDTGELEDEIHSETIIAEYEKMPRYGLQCFFKLWIYNKKDHPKDYIYWCVQPDLYYALEQEGSIKIEYNWLYNLEHNGYFAFNVKLASDDNVTKNKVDDWWNKRSSRISEKNLTR